MRYPVNLTLTLGKVTVTCPDLPDLAAVGKNAQDALAAAMEGIEEQLQDCMQNRQSVPMPSRAAPGQQTVDLPPLVVAKIGLYQAMLNQGLRKADLARRLNVHLPQVDRLLDLRHKSKLGQVELALKTMGLRIKLTVEPL